MTTRILFALLVSSAIPGPANATTADRVELVLGKFVSEGEWATQVVSVRNKLKKQLMRIEVECGFFNGDQLVASATAAIGNLEPGATGFGEVLADDATGATSAKCRVVSVE